MARYWGPKIKIDGEWVRDTSGKYHSWSGGEQWEAEVQSVLRKIEHSTTGKLLLSLINGTPAHRRRQRRGQSPLMCEIVPIQAVEYQQTSTKRAHDEQSMKKGSRAWVLSPNDEIYTPIAGVAIPTHARMLSGTGDGVNVTIYYHPATWNAHGQMIGLDTLQLFADVAGDTSLASLGPIDHRLGLDTADDNFQPDDVLFHELVHAYRCMLGIFEFVATGDTWDATEEVFAIVLTNVYVSEIGRSGSLRGDHREQFHSLSDVSGSDSDEDFYLGFSNGKSRLIDQMCEEMPEITDVLSDPEQRIGTWNPFRVRRRNLEGIEKMRGKY